MKLDSHAVTAIVSVLIGITGVAIIAVLVSGQSNTASVFGAGGGAIQQMICTALSPITGTNCKSLTPVVNSTIHF
jgi:hypothetical protein